MYPLYSGSPVERCCSRCRTFAPGAGAPSCRSILGRVGAPGCERPEWARHHLHVQRCCGCCAEVFFPALSHAGLWSYAAVLQSVSRVLSFASHSTGPSLPAWTVTLCSSTQSSQLGEDQLVIIAQRYLRSLRAVRKCALETCREARIGAHLADRAKLLSARHLPGLG